MREGRGHESGGEPYMADKTRIKRVVLLTMLKVFNYDFTKWEFERSGEEQRNDWIFLTIPNLQFVDTASWGQVVLNVTKKKKHKAKGNVEMFNDARRPRLYGSERVGRETENAWSLSLFRDRFVLREMEKRLEGRYTTLTWFVGKI